MLAAVSGQAPPLEPSSSARPARLRLAAAVPAGRRARRGPPRRRPPRTAASQPGPGLVPLWTTRRASRALLGDSAATAARVRAVAALPDGRVVSGGYDGRVLLWDAAEPGARPGRARPPRRPGAGGGGAAGRAGGQRRRRRAGADMECDPRTGRPAGLFGDGASSRGQARRRFPRCHSRRSGVLILVNHQRDDNGPL